MKRYRLAVCKGPDCRKNGADQVFAAAKDAVQAGGLASLCLVNRGGCYGLCHLGPNVVVRPEVGHPRNPLSPEDYQLMGWEGEVHYPRMTPEKIAQVVAEHLGGDAPVKAFLGEQ